MFFGLQSTHATIRDGVKLRKVDYKIRWLAIHEESVSRHFARTASINATPSYRLE